MEQGSIVPRTATNWTGDDDPEDPHNWPAPRKLLSLFTVGSIAFVSTLAGSLYAPGHDALSADLNVSTTVSLLPLSCYNVGLAFGPVIGAPLSETFGRKAVYVTTLPLFALFILGSGFSRDIASLVICRFFAGVFGSPGISFAGATIADMWYPVDRGTAMSVYYSMPFIGAVVGPLIGGFVVEAKGWRWTQWTTLFFTIAFGALTPFLKESYKKSILQRRASALSIEGPTPPRGRIVNEIRLFLRVTIGRPIHMLCTEPIVCLICLYSAFIFGLLYCFIIASPYVFKTVYGFSLGARGLSFIGFIIGCLVCPLILVVTDHYVYQRSFAVFKASLSKEMTLADFPPEHRLYCAIAGSLLLPCGMFWFAWTARPGIHWACPIAAQAITIMGSILIYVSLNLYMMDTYGPLYGASANGASSLVRYTLSAAFPLFTLQMYEGVGVAWATTILAVFAVILAPIPWAFFYYGSRLRARTKYERSL